MQQALGQPAERPERFSIDIASGVLVSLGVKNYTSIGKSLAEFVANAYDAEASRVEITIPFQDIERERTAIRAVAKAEVEAGKRERFTALATPLPDDVKIVSKDNGHGMSPGDVENKYLIVSRNRREASPKSETGERFFMGRKGLGKLAGFGTAEKISIWTKRAGDTFATEFTMNYGEIAQQAKVHESFFEAVYHDGLPPETKGTVITLSSLRCDSLKASANGANPVPTDAEGGNQGRKRPATISTPYRWRALSSLRPAHPARITSALKVPDSLDAAREVPPPARRRPAKRHKDPRIPLRRVGIGPRSQLLFWR
jgi:hypothetical protein